MNRLSLKGTLLALPNNYSGFDVLLRFLNIIPFFLFVCFFVFKFADDGMLEVASYFPAHIVLNKANELCLKGS